MTYQDLCYECGKKEYGEIDVDGLTIHLDECPECGEKKGLIPARDWRRLSK